MAYSIVLNKKYNSDFDGFKFVVKILTKSKTERRPHMLHIFIDDGRVVATDGKRLHAFDYSGKYRKGFYIVELNSKTKIILVRVGNSKSIAYPEYKHLFVQKGIEIEADKTYENTFYMEIYKKIKGERTININYLKDLPLREYSVVMVENDEQFEMAIFSHDRINAIITAMYA